MKTYRKLFSLHYISYFSKCFWKKFKKGIDNQFSIDNNTFLTLFSYKYRISSTSSIGHCIAKGRVSSNSRSETKHSD